MRGVKIVLWIVAGLIILIVAAAAIFVATFDPNRYKPDAIKLVRDRYNRTLAIDGDIKLSLFPRLGVALAKVSLSEPGSSKLFARIDEARASLALLPLLSKRIVVDHIELRGLDAELVKYADGRTNFDDLTGTKDEKTSKRAEPKQTPAGAFAIDISGITLQNAAVGWRDETNGTRIKLSGAELATDRIADDVPGRLKLSARVQGAQPKMDLALKMSTGYRLNFTRAAYSFTGLDITAQGDVPGVAGLDASVKGDASLEGANRINLSNLRLAATSKDGLDARFDVPKLLLTPERSESAAISGEIKLTKSDQTLDAKVALAAVEAKANVVQFSNLGIDLDLKAGDMRLQGKIATPVTLNLEGRQAQLSRLQGDLAVSGPAIPGKSTKLSLTGFANADWGKKNANAELSAKIDDSNLRVRAGVVNYEQPAINFDVEGDRLDLDRYFPSKKDAASAPNTGGNKSDASARAEPEKPFDFAAAKTLNASGQVRLGALTASKVHVENLRVTMKAAGGRIELAPITANLYQGTLAGNALINASNNSFVLKQTLTGIAIGPLLRDAADKDLLEGRGSVNLDLRTAGTTASALNRALDGTASLNLRDGSIKGINLAETYRRARSLVSGGAQEVNATTTEKTDFTSLTASFVIRNGVAHNEDLLAQSPFIRLSGAGDIDLGASRMNYTARATIVSTPAGQDAKPGDRTRGVTVPVQLAGPLDNLKYRIDFAALATDAAKDEARKRLEETVDKRLGDELKGPARDLLRGILGR